MKIKLNILLVIPLVFLINACSHVEYLSRSSYQEYRGEEDHIKLRSFRDGHKLPREYGGLIIKKNPEDKQELNSEEAVYNLAFKRQKKKFYAEAVLYDGRDKENSFVDQTLFDFGIDKNQRSFNIGLTLKY
jgi:hypothetical protein